MVNWQDKLKQFASDHINDYEPPSNDEKSLETDLWDSVAAKSPLQELIHSPCNSTDDKKLIEQRLNALKKAKEVDHDSCSSLYAALTQRIEVLADETVTAEFPWRVRVGGMLGFQEILLPVFHPIYGIPYVPASSIKGMVRAWATQALPEQAAAVNQLLGCLSNSDSRLASVQFLDAFPTAPCLSVDIATPQWDWNDSNKVEYAPSPHPMLSMENVTIRIGLKCTSLGKVAEVETVRDWLEKALVAEGLGGRISAGYGRTLKAIRTGQSATSQYAASKHPFELWSEGIHGVEREINEFRPVAIRGVLRYWFRAVALGLYSPMQCRELESELFGAIQPTARTGSLRISAEIEKENSGRDIPYMASGHIKLEAKNEMHLHLAQQLLILACHLGGVGQGSRRPLHWNSNRFRGSYWQLTQAEIALNSDAASWTVFLEKLKHAFSVVAAFGTPILQSPGNARNRYQGVLNKNSRIYLVPSPNLKHPEDVKAWRTEGSKPKVRGAALEFFYSSGFKGDNKRRGNDANTINAHVGGERGVPSFVWIASNQLRIPAQAYQVITIFDIQQADRELFERQLKQQRGAVQVWLL